MTREPHETAPVPGDGISVIATTGAHVVRGGVWNLTSSMVPQVYTLVVSIFAARELGPEGLGRQSLIAFVELSIVSLLGGGFSVALMRHVAERTGAGAPGVVAGLFTWAWRFAILTAAASWAVLLGIAVAGGEPTEAWVLAAFVCLGSVLATVPSAVLIGLQRWRDATIAGLIVGGIAMPVTVAVLLLGGGITGMFAVETVSVFAGLAWTTRLARRASRTVAGHPLQADAALRRSVVRFALVASAGVLLELIVWRRSELLFLAHFSTDTEIAYYSIAFAVVTAVARITSMAASVLAPTFAYLHGAGAYDRIRSGYGRATRLLAVVALPAVALTLALGPETVSVVWGEDFASAGDALLVLAAASPFVPIAVIASSVLVGIGRIRILVVFEVAAAFVDIVLALLLVPRHGALGAAFANAGAQVVSGGVVYAYTIRVVGWPQARLGRIARTAVAALAAGAIAWAIQHQVHDLAGVVIGLVAGSAAFLVMSAALHVLDADDAATLEEAAGPRLRRPVRWLLARLRPAS